MVRPTLDSIQDTKLRIFVDTNVLIDFSHGLDEKYCKAFLKLFSAKNFENIEVVTSDYVLWEFYGHFKDELYARKLVKDHHYGIISASKEWYKGKKFEKATSSDMEDFGKAIQKKVKEFEDKPVNIQRLIGKQQNGFSEIVEAILQRSKFSYKDTIVFVSALLTQSQMIITCDRDFSSEKHIESVKNALQNLQREFKPPIQFKKPIELSSEDKVKVTYRDWFLKNNYSKLLGSVRNVFLNVNSLYIECSNNNFIEIGDYLLLVKFVNTTDFKSSLLRVKRRSLRDSVTNQPVKTGNKVTWKLASGKIKPFMNGAMVFLVED